MSDEAQAPQQAQASQGNGAEAAAWVGVVILIGLALYVVALGVITADQWFGLEWFPKALEKDALLCLDKFETKDEAEFATAQKELMDIEDFVTVPMLLRRLKSSSTVLRARSYDTLSKIAERLKVPGPAFSSDAPADQRAAAVKAWREWAETNDKML